MESLRPAWMEYTSSVSTPDMAASLELAGLLDALVRMTRPARVADLGSGFSSYVLRRPELGIAEVFSVDDSEPWLQATDRFLRSKGLSVEHLMLWERFEADSAGRFNLTLHDLGSMDARERMLGAAVGSLSSPGLIVLDDCHKGGYRTAVKSFFSSHPSNEVFDCKNITLDAFGRYAWVATSTGEL